MFSFKWLIVLILALFGLPYLAGCSSMLPDKGFDVVNGMASQAREGLAAGSAQWSASFEGVNPGVTVEAGVKYFARAYYDGVAGQFSANAAGELSGLDAEAKAHVREIEKSTTLNTREKNQLIADVLRGALKIKPSTDLVGGTDATGIPKTTPAPSGGTSAGGVPTAPGSPAPAVSVVITSVDVSKHLGFSRLPPDNTLVIVNGGDGLLGQSVNVIPIATGDGFMVATLAGG